MRDNMALPDFGLMTKADKQKLDAIDTSTLLTKTEASATYLTQAAASETYATKTEMKSYIRQVLESDTGFVFLDGNSSEVGVIPAFTKSTPTLTVTNSNLIGTNQIGQNRFSLEPFVVSTNSDGEISAQLSQTFVDMGYTVNVSGNEVTVAFEGGAPNYGDYPAALVISVSETGNFATAFFSIDVYDDSDDEEEEEDDDDETVAPAP